LTETTFVIIKPDAVFEMVSGEIITIIERNIFCIEDMRKLKLTQSQAEYFYRKDKDKRYFNKNIRFMTSGQIIAMVVSGESVVERMRQLIGATSPSMRTPGTIRYMYGSTITQNAIHASDSASSALEEITEYCLTWC